MIKHLHIRSKWLFTAIIAFALGVIQAQSTSSSIKNGVGIGFNITEHQSDFGMGLNLVSPAILNQRIALRLNANLVYHQHLVNNVYRWTPYSNISLGLVGYSGMVTNRIRLYGEGGVIAIQPSSDFSSSQMDVGGYGLFGFEFFFAEFGNYYIEIGSVGIGAVADKVNAQPIYSNGMSLSVGFRFFL